MKLRFWDTYKWISCILLQGGGGAKKQYGLVGEAPACWYKDQNPVPSSANSFLCITSGKLSLLYSLVCSPIKWRIMVVASFLNCLEMHRWMRTPFQSSLTAMAPDFLGACFGTVQSRMADLMGFPSSSLQILQSKHPLPLDLTYFIWKIYDWFCGF